MVTRECITRWANIIKPNTYTIRDSYSIGPIINLTNLLQGIFKDTPRQSSDQSAINSTSQRNWFRGHHFIFNCQGNKHLGSDGYDNYQAPVIDNQQLYLRRLWAKGSIQFNQAPKVNSALECTEQVKTVKPFGEDVFVDIERKYTSNKDSDPLLVENRTLLYTNQLYAPNKTPKLATSQPLVTFKVSTIDLLKYSMLTYNLHRIHYDPKYAHSIENLPTVLVHGPLQVTLVLYYFSLKYPNLVASQFKYRTFEPFFVNEEAGISIIAQGSNEFELTLLNVAHKKVYLKGTLKCK
ncbi:hypothetical protein CANMA_000459 [Candida margitis]|uniref:uncharacterized protein n=1 Tax=Candida margitis TaxID=1775924 RepID=UPI00222679D3|nr:uncharacterized protein CANMA_000459 [Candida margitis]KAI5970550.1 hypothetical protein CANMA_000459 [Candida margitis]